MTYFIQGGGNDEFPFFPEQPGNGNGNPPPFGEPTANINSTAFIIIMFIIAIILFLKYIKPKL